MALVTDTPTPQPTEREIFEAAMVSAMRAVKTVQEIGARYFYGPHSGRRTLAEMQARVDQYGKEAAAVFKISEMFGMIGYLATGEVGSIMPKGVTYAIDDKTGRVTLSGKVDEPAPTPPVVEE